MKHASTIRMKQLGIILWLTALSSTAAFPQDSLRLKGTILSTSNEPLPEVSISIEGSMAMPVVTDGAGQFDLKVPSGNPWLIINPPGRFKQKRIYLSGREQLKIYLSPAELQAGSDPLIVLDQTVSRKDMVAAHQDLGITDVNKSASVTIDSYFKGRVSGMQVTNRSGDPGSGAVGLIRGPQSVNANNQPLYLVDGLPLTPFGLFGSNVDGFSTNPLLSVSTAGISKITVIKDPVILAAYGSKASNGLIMIETLNPSATQTEFELDVTGGFRFKPRRLLPQLSAVQHKTLVNEILFTSGEIEELITDNYPGLYLLPEEDRYIDYQNNTNWQEHIFENAPLSAVNLTVKGGDDIARYGLLFGYTNQQGVIKQTGYEGYNLRFVSALNVFRWMEMNASVSFNYGTSSLKESAIANQTSPIATSLAKSPMLNPFQYDPDGNEINIYSEVEELGVSNPLATIDNFEATARNYQFISSLGLKVTISRALSVISRLGLNYNSQKEEMFKPNHGMELYFNDEAYNVAIVSNNTFLSVYNNTYLNFNRQFGSDHHVRSSTGMHLLTSRFQYDWGLTKNAHESDEYRRLNNGTNILREMGGRNSDWNWLNFYEFLAYAYQDKYLLNASVSMDGSSRVGKSAENTVIIADQPFGLFYSAGIGWRISNEPFLHHTGWLEELKIRASYGKIGNDDVGITNSINWYEARRYRQAVGLHPAILYNNRLTYESVYQINAGLDLAFLGNRFRTNFDLYRSLTDDLLIYAPVDAYLGNDFRPVNNGSMENRGWDAAAFLRIIDAASVQWDVRLNISSVKNKIIDIEGGKLVTPIEGGEIVNMKGEKANSFYGYIYEGVYATTQDASEAGLVNDKGMAYGAGDAIYRDISGPGGEPDGVINSFDKTVIGSALPDFTGGIMNSLTFRRWELSVLLDIVAGRDVYNYLRFRNQEMSGLENQSIYVLNRWESEGQETDVPKAAWQDPMGNSSFSTRWIEDGMYARLANVYLSYTIPDKFLAFRNAEFYASALNLITVSSYLGYDPEFGYSYLQVNQGIDYGLTPMTRQVIIGAKLGF